MRQAIDPEIKALFTTLIEGQIRTDQSISSLVKTIGRYVDAADARMKHGLIRAITREHMNGKSRA